MKNYYKLGASTYRIHMADLNISPNNNKLKDMLKAAWANLSTIQEYKVHLIYW